MVATFLGCAVVTHWLPYTSVQIFFCLFLELKRVWYYLSSLNIHTRVFSETLHITLVQGRKIVKNLKGKECH